MGNHIEEYDTEHDTIINGIVDLEWDQFQRTTNEGGQAACQTNRPMFRIMRRSQFLVWPARLLRSYRADLAEANRIGRNLITEKYARMMASTVPDEYHRSIEPYLPALDADRTALQEQIIATQVAWADDFRTRYPHLGDAMRVLRSSEDTPDVTSFETYLRGELSTYSPQTLDLYAAFVDQLRTEQRNMTEEIVQNTVLMSGFDSLEDAESHVA